jgi:hypothetical protein
MNGGTYSKIFYKVIYKICLMNLKQMKPTIGRSWKNTNNHIQNFDYDSFFVTLEDGFNTSTLINMMQVQVEKY